MDLQVQTVGTWGSLALRHSSQAYCSGSTAVLIITNAQGNLRLDGKEGKFSPSLEGKLVGLWAFYFSFAKSSWLTIAVVCVALN